jgi:hypothetical protein
MTAVGQTDEFFVQVVVRRPPRASARLTTNSIEMALAQYREPSLAGQPVQRRLHD